MLITTGKAVSGLKRIFTASLIVYALSVHTRAQDINDKFKCMLKDLQSFSLHYDGTEVYRIISESRDFAPQKEPALHESPHSASPGYMYELAPLSPLLRVTISSTITRFTICRPLNDDFSGTADDYILYIVECFQLGDQLMSSVTSASIVDKLSAQGRECQASTRAVLPLSATTMVSGTTTTTVTNITTTPWATTTVEGLNMSSLVALQVLDSTGFVVDRVTTPQSIHLRIQAFSTEVYKLPFVNRCWYIPSLSSDEEVEEYEMEDNGLSEEELELFEDTEEEGTMFIEYGCALLEPVLISAETRKGDLWSKNGPLDVVTKPFNLQSLFDLDFDTLTFKCEVDLCTLDQHCRWKCPADGKTYRIPPNRTVNGIISAMVMVDKQETTTEARPTKPTTKVPLIIRQTEYPSQPKAEPKTGMDKAQPYLIIGCVIVGCIVMFLLCYITVRISSDKTKETEGNPQDYGKFNLRGHGGPGHMSYGGSGQMSYGGKMVGPSPPPVYNAQPRGREASTPSHSQYNSQLMTQPLLATSPTRGRLPQQTELLMSPSRLSTSFPSRYQDSHLGTVVGGEYYPIRDRPAGQLIGRELYYVPEGLGPLDQSGANLLGRGAFLESGSPEKRTLGKLLAKEAASKHGSSAKRDLFGIDSQRDLREQKISDVGNLVSKSLSEYIDRHGVAALADVGHD